jgi:hypothetical protein
VITTLSKLGEVRTLKADPFPQPPWTYTLTVTAQDRNAVGEIQEVPTEVKVMVGERAPQFMNSSYVVSVMENNEALER